jgi:uncharacterized protein YndB with AHSA1/START domain
MRLVENIFIRRPVTTVWAFLENPANMPLWNPKVKRVSTLSFNGPRQGYRYAITYQMHERSIASEFLAEFIHFEPPSKLVIRHTGALSHRNGVIEERYELIERDGGTFLIQSIHIDHSGINIFFRFLIWLIQRWGKPTGKRYLETLRDIIEKDTKRGCDPFQLHGRKDGF